MLSLSSAAKLEKNKLQGSGPWITLLELVLPDATTIRVCDNLSDVTWPATGGYLWQAFPFELDVVANSPRGELPSVALRISNVTRIIQGYLESADGAIGAVVTLRVVHASHLDLTTPELMETFDVTAAAADATWVTATLGAANPLLCRFPRHRYLRDHCRWIYKSAECAYSGELTTCKRTLADCRLHSNTVRFGGFPGIPGGAIYKI